MFADVAATRAPDAQGPPCGGPVRDQFFSTSGLGGGSAYFLVISHCCSRPRPPLATWYSTRPAGRKARTTPKINGLVCILLRCLRSLPELRRSSRADPTIALV